MSDKPLPPTAKRLRDALAEGNVARSDVFTGFVATVLVTEALFALVYTGIDQWLALQSAVLSCITGHDRIDACPQPIPFVIGSVAATVGLIASIAVLSATFSAWICGGLTVAPKAIKPSLKRLDAIRHVKALFGAKNLATVALALTSATLVGVVAYCALRRRLVLVDAMVEWQSLAFDLRAGIATLHSFVRALFAALIVPAVLSVVIARRQHRRTLRMTYRELKDEVKQTMSDPSMRARQRASFAEAVHAPPPVSPDGIRRALITNPEQFAVLLDYSGDEFTPPVVAAKAMNDDAIQMTTDALLDRVIVFRFRRLARHLYRHGELQAGIPAECYRAVAIIYRIVEELEGFTDRPNLPIEIDDIAFDS